MLVAAQHTFYTDAIRVTAYAALIVLSACATFGSATGRTALVILMVATIADYRNTWHAFHKNPIFLVALVLGIYVIVRGIFVPTFLTNSVPPPIGALRPWLLLLTFPIVGYWSRQSDRFILWCLGVALGGLIVTLFMQFDWPHAERILIDGQRSFFGMWPSDVGLFSGSALLGLVAVTDRVLRPGPLATIRRVMWSVTVIFLIEVIFISQSRSTWGGLIILVPSTLAVSLMNRQNKCVKLSVGFAIGLFVAVIALGYVNSVGVRERTHGAIETAHLIVQNPLSETTAASKNVAPTSFIQRLWIWRFAFNSWKQHPLVGWGPGADIMLELPNAPHQPDSAMPYGHVHNGYLQILVRFGIIGFLTVTTLGVFLILAIHSAWKKGKIAKDVLIALLSMTIFGSIVNLTDVYIMRPGYTALPLAPDIAFTLVVIGLIYGCTLEKRNEQPVARGTKERSAERDNA